MNGTKTAEVSEWSNKLVAALRTSSVLRDVASEAAGRRSKRLFVKIDRQLAGRLGISVQNINDTLYDAFGQRQVSTIYAQTNQYRVVLEAQPGYLADDDLRSRNLYVSSDVAVAGAAVDLHHADARHRAALRPAPPSQFPAVTISFNLEDDGESLSNAVQAIADASTAIGMPPSITGRVCRRCCGIRELAPRTSPRLILAAAITIYIVLGVLYESAIHPITILSTLPSAGVRRAARSDGVQDGSVADRADRYRAA